MLAVKKISRDAVLIGHVLDQYLRYVYIYKTRWRVAYASGCYSQIFETSLLAFVTANGGTVSLNVSLGSGNFSSEVFKRGFKYYNIDINFFLHECLHVMSCVRLTE